MLPSTLRLCLWHYTFIHTENALFHTLGMRSFLCSYKNYAIGVGIGGARGAMAPPIISVQMLCITVFEIIKKLRAAVSQ